MNAATSRRPLPPWLLPFFGLLGLVTVLVVVLILSVRGSLLRDNRLLPVSIRSSLQADYSADPRPTRAPPADLRLIAEVLVDQGVEPTAAQARLGEVKIAIQTGVPSITPEPSATPTVQQSSGLPTIVFPTAIPSATPTVEATHKIDDTPSPTDTPAPGATPAVSRTRPPSATPPPLPSNTPEPTLSLAPSATPASVNTLEPSHTPTAGDTPAPTRTLAPSASPASPSAATPAPTSTSGIHPPTTTTPRPSDTPIPPSDTPRPSNTPVPPSNTPVPPSNTPVPPSNTPVPPSNTPVPPSNTPVPPSNTPPPSDTPAVVLGMHVGDLDASKAAHAQKWEVTITVQVHDANEAPLAGVTVRGNFKGDTLRCTTDGAGQCSFQSQSADISRDSSITFTISRLSLTGYTYDSAANHDPDGDSNGTQIVVTFP